MDSPPISGSIFQQAGTLISHSTSAIAQVAGKWFAKKEVREEIRAESPHLQQRRNSIIRNYSAGDMLWNVERYANENEKPSFKLALEKFEEAQERLNRADTEESLSARKQAMANAFESLKKEYQVLHLDEKIKSEKEKRQSETKDKTLRQSLVGKALRVKAALGETQEMERLETIMEDDPEIANALLDARLAIIKNKPLQ